MTDQQKRTAINTATINLAKGIRDNAISKVIDVIKTTVSSTANAELLDPQLTLSATEVTANFNTPATVTVSYLGEGTITISTNYEGSPTPPTYDSSTNTITIPFADVGSFGTITVSLSSDGTYAAASATIAATFNHTATPR